VKNCPDGSVQGEAQGTVSDIDSFLAQIKVGPPRATVSNVEHEEIALKENENSFVQTR
jgi:acylphosphatase